jgi:plastocyanin
MKKALILLTICIVAVAAVGIGSDAARAADRVTVRMTSQGFEPREVTVQKGDTVVFENNDAQYRWPASNIHPTHNIYPEFDPKAEAAPGASWEFQFDEVGRWKYHDHLLPQFSGTVVVEATNDNNDNNHDQKGSGFWHKVGQWFSDMWYRLTHWGKGRGNNNDGNNGNETSSIDISRYNQDITEGSEKIFKDDSALGSHLNKYGTQKTITALRLLESKFGSCHQPAHRAGHMGYKLFGDSAFVEYSAECQSGYYHGVMEAYFQEHGAGDLKTSLVTLCRGGLNNFFEHQCIHGIGHGLMAWTNYELPEALAACDELPKRQDSCWTGVFMENLAAQLANGSAKTAVGDTDTHLTKYLKADDALYPCNSVETKYQNSCYFLQTSRMLQIFGQDFKKIANACAKAPAAYQRSCYGSMGRDVSGSFAKDNARQIHECNYATESDNRLACLSGAVQNSFWDPTGQTVAIDFCMRLTQDSEKQGCYTTIFDRATQLLTTRAQLDIFCAAVEDAFMETCKHTVTHA